MAIQQFLYNINPKKLFLIDSLGALLSAGMLGIVLTRFESTVGMPKQVLYFLAILACIFAVYSFLCFLWVKSNWQIYLKIIALVNLAYCCLTIGLIIYEYQELTNLGLCYFVLEIIVVTVLAMIELKTASR